MPTYAAASIRNVAVVGHNGSGKTQLISALLFTAGATTRLGKVDDGTAPTDFDDEAIARKHTLGDTPAWLEWQGTKINLVDTPGSATSSARRARRCASPTRRSSSSTPWRASRCRPSASGRWPATSGIAAHRRRQSPGSRARQLATALDDLQSPSAGRWCRCSCPSARSRASAASSTSWRSAPTPTKAATVAASRSPFRSPRAEAREARERWSNWSPRPTTS